MQPVHVDAALLVFDKPAGLLAVPGRGADKQDCLLARARHTFPEALVVHRLDMATSGLMLLARTRAAQRTLSQAFEQRLVHKRYVARVQGHVVEQAGGGWHEIDLPIAADWPRRPLQMVDAVQGRPSVTRWRLLQREMATSSRLELAPVTGRSHQLRVHLNAIGHPIVGDALYGGAVVVGETAAARLMLHATVLAFAHPASGQGCRFESEAPF